MKLIRYVLNCLVGVVVAGLMTVFLLPRLFGYQPYMVVSASMQQSFPVGSLIFVRDASPEEIQVGDPITFTAGSLVVTHRVIAIDSENRVFTTKGDSNNASEITPFDNLRGKALNFCIPNMGYFSAWFITPAGRFITAMVILSTAALSVVLGKLDELDEPEEPEKPGEKTETEPINDQPAAVGAKEGESG
ncbi:MAG: signal peptidase I [Clostridia bacterium]|nr:signal peptidase I [Clostridia bacterium]